MVTEPFFNIKISEKDTTKYIFNKSKLGKSRLVLEVIKFYVDTHPKIIYRELVAEFSLHLQRGNGRFAILEEATKIYNQTGHKRHYIKPDEQIKLFDCVIAISNQWGIGNIGGFIERAKSLGYEIKLVN